MVPAALPSRRPAHGRHFEGISHQRSSGIVTFGNLCSRQLFGVPAPKHHRRRLATVPWKGVDNGGVCTRSTSGAHGTEADERRKGRDVRKSVARQAHADWTPAPNRPDPIAILEAQNASRVPDLVPVRWGRMLESPFAFLRGSAAVMAMDLATTPVTEISVQVCGDAHVANFGLFASPERNLLFDVNDFDETHVGPWEWDVKRLAASAVVAARDASLSCESPAGRGACGRPFLSTSHEALQHDVLCSTCGTRGSIPKRRRRFSARRRGPSRSPSTVPAATPQRPPCRNSLRSWPTGPRRIVDHPPLVTHEGVDDGASTLRRLFDGLCRLSRRRPRSFAAAICGPGLRLEGRGSRKRQGHVASLLSCRAT